MIYTTRNQSYAEQAINSLPFTDGEKSKIKSFFPATTNLMNHMKKNKTFNSKGGERWFSERLSRASQESMKMVVPQPDMSLMELYKLQFLSAQIACCDATMLIARECECDESLTVDLQGYVDFLKDLLDKYLTDNRLVVGDRVEVDYPQENDMWNHSFVGTIIEVQEDYVAVRDSDDNVYNPLFTQVKKIQTE